MKKYILLALMLIALTSCEKRYRCFCRVNSDNGTETHLVGRLNEHYTTARSRYAAKKCDEFKNELGKLYHTDTAVATISCELEKY